VAGGVGVSGIGVVEEGRREEGGEEDDEPEAGEDEDGGGAAGIGRGRRGEVVCKLICELICEVVGEGGIDHGLRLLFQDKWPGAKSLWIESRDYGVVEDDNEMLFVA
jgi:hypothetical protein